MCLYSKLVLSGKCADPTPEHGSTLEQDFSFGKWVTFECDPGYELTGKTTIQCVLGSTPDDCTWSEAPPHCQCKMTVLSCEVFIFKFLFTIVKQQYKSLFASRTPVPCLCTLTFNNWRAQFQNLLHPVLTCYSFEA